MKTRRRIVAVVLVLTAAAAGVAAYRHWRKPVRITPEKAMAFIRGADRVELVFDPHREPEPARRIITDSQEIRRLVSLIQLERKDPCACSHVEMVIFRRGGATLEVCICDHCFDVMRNSSVTRGWAGFAMPAAFYAEYQKYKAEFERGHGRSGDVEN